MSSMETSIKPRSCGFQDCVTPLHAFYTVEFDGRVFDFCKHHAEQVVDELGLTTHI